MNESNGNLPTSLGNVWAGEVQSCIVDWPPQPFGQPWVPWVQPTYAPVPVQPCTHYHFMPAPLSDADVERIAKRVAELLREEYRPLPPEVLAAARHDTAHEDAGSTRPAVATREDKP